MFIFAILYVCATILAFIVGRVIGYLKDKVMDVSSSVR